jgi:hypothetical protein
MSLKMEIFLQFFIGFLMFGLSVVVHAIGLDFIIRRVGRYEKLFKKVSKSLWKAWITSVVVLCIFTIHIIIMWLWAVLYLSYRCEPITSLSDTLYLSMVTYSTLGFGDIILEPSCKLMTGIQGANGFMLFGWTTAFIFEIVSRIYSREAKSL